jgi:murein L,D-transpeptidase YcbB/YkuD
VHYTLVKESLVRMRALAAESTLTRLPPLPGGKSLREGDEWSGVPKLWQLLSALGDAPAGLTPDSASLADSLRLTADVADALRRFQRRTGLDADGVLGRGTFASLTRPVTDKVRSLELTLERWRWLPHAFGAPPLIVNVPAFRLYAFSDSRDDEAELLRMDVVVGKAFDTRTPIFSDTLTTLSFSPYWDVPPSIMRGEILPAARKDATYLSRNRFEVVRGDGDNAPSLGTGADAVAALQAGRARVRQLPGPNNSLGRVKFLFPNSFNIYFHDTPAQSVFARARRDASHGCIRLADPVGLAKLLLKDDENWTDARIAESMNLDRPVYVRLKQPRPVFILYATAMTTQDGETRFYPDIYGFDDELARRLAAGFPYSTERAVARAR